MRPLPKTVRSCCRYQVSTLPSLGLFLTTRSVISTSAARVRHGKSPTLGLCNATKSDKHHQRLAHNLQLSETCLKPCERTSLRTESIETEPGMICYGIETSCKPRKRVARYIESVTSLRDVRRRRLTTETQAMDNHCCRHMFRYLRDANQWGEKEQQLSRYRCLRKALTNFPVFEGFKVQTFKSWPRKPGSFSISFPTLERRV